MFDIASGGKVLGKTYGLILFTSNMPHIPLLKTQSNIKWKIAPNKCQPLQDVDKCRWPSFQ